MENEIPQIWDGTEQSSKGFEVALKLIMPTCDECREVIHDLKHSHWPKGKQLCITPDISVHGKFRGFHASWIEVAI